MFAVYKTYFISRMKLMYKFDELLLSFFMEGSVLLQDSIEFLNNICWKLIIRFHMSLMSLTITFLWGLGFFEGSLGQAIIVLPCIIQTDQAPVLFHPIPGFFLLAFQALRNQC